MTEHPLLNAAVFAALGVLLFLLAGAILLKLTPLKLWREIVDQHNVAVAVFAGAVAIAIALIIAAAMH
jgi:putative membrane protein